MKKSKELLLFRYLIFIILLAEILLLRGNNPTFAIIFICALIINNHLRIFYIESNSKLIENNSNLIENNKQKNNIQKANIAQIISMIIEIVAVIICKDLLGGNIILYFAGIIIDLFDLEYKYIKYPLLGALYLYILEESNIITKAGIINLAIITGLYILLFYISQLYKGKKEAQFLYDKLRISEENLKKANEELENLTTTIEEVTVLRERNRISREIHDSVGHALSTAMIQLSAMERIAEVNNDPLGEMAKSLREFINESFQDVKKAVKDLKPDEYENFEGVIRITEACKTFEKLSGVKVKINISEDKWILSTKQSQNLYRVTQEILSNALRHGKATEIKIIMNYLENEMVMSFKDNGVGTDEIKETGVGLKSIRERIQELDGMVTIESKKGEGFFVKITIPKEREI